MKKYSIAELLDMGLEELPKTKMGLSQKAEREKWPFEEVKAKGGRGGVKRLYTLPPEVLEQIQAKEVGRVLSRRPEKILRSGRIRRRVEGCGHHRGAAQLRRGAAGGVE